MIPTSSVLTLVGFDAFSVCSGDNEDVAMTTNFVADSPSFDILSPRRGSYDVDASGKRALPSLHPIGL